MFSHVFTSFLKSVFMLTKRELFINRTDHQYDLLEPVSVVLDVMEVINMIWGEYEILCQLFRKGSYCLMKCVNVFIDLLLLISMSRQIGYSRVLYV